MSHGDEAAAEWSRSYYVPDPPKIPLPPGAIETTAPPEEPGYTGPRFRTLLRGDDWNDPQVGIPAAVPYTFATRAMSNYSTVSGDSAEPGFAATSGEPLDAVQQASIRQALSAWEQVSGLTFIEVADPEAWGFDGIRFLLESVDVDQLLGRTYPNTEPYGFNIAFNRVEYGDATLQPGTMGYWTALHEIGHAIGLKHPFDDDPVLKVSEDTNKNTVMSYTDKGNLSRLGPFDIDAVQHIYGTPEAEAAAAAIHWSAGPNGAMVTTANDDANIITGFSVRDIVHAGGGDDYIAVSGGDDHVVSGAGSDAVFGGVGEDTLYTGVLRRQAAVASAMGGQGIEGTIAVADGLDSFYGVETLSFVDGSLALNPQAAVGQLYRLYLAALGREPDGMGFSYWAEALQDGDTTVAKVAADFAGSPEFAARYGALSDFGFVSQLYENVLGRPPAPEERLEVNYWVHAIQAGGRAGVLLGFSESEEHREKTEAAFTGGTWFANADAVDVLRGYVAVLDRRPDAEGLVNWTNAREAGMGQPELIAHLASSLEFQIRFGGLSNRDFVEQLYRTSLDRAADADGLTYWARVLDAGIDGRAGVALGFAGSAEMTAKIAPLVEYNALFA